MKRTAMALAMVSMVFLAGGCLGRAVKEGLGAARGGKGRFHEVRLPAQPLGMYRNIEVAGFTSGFGGRMPSSLLTMLPGQITKQLRDKELPVAGSGRTMVIRGDVIYYETAPASGQIFGPLEEAIANVELLDKASGKVIAKSCCVGRSTSTTSQGVGTKAEGIAEAVAAWIAKHRPKPSG